jgi:hypothetical protein
MCLSSDHHWHKTLFVADLAHYFLTDRLSIVVHEPSRRKTSTEPWE